MDVSRCFSKIQGAIANIETIAKGSSVKSRSQLKKKYGTGNWMKKKDRLWSSCPVVSNDAQRSIGMKLTGSVEKNSKSSGSSTKSPRLPRLTSGALRFVVCIKSDANIDLEVGKIYRVRRDVQAQREGFLRVFDASAEDYLYPREYFSPVAARSNLFSLFQ